MGWLQNRKARKTLQGLGLSDETSSQIIADLTQGQKDAIKLRNELRKKESKTYKKLIKQINYLSYEPIPIKQKYEQTLELIHGASLTEWERNDLLEQTEGLYNEFLTASTYAQVLGMLNHFKGDNVTKIQKMDNSIKLIEVSDITEAQKNELKDQVKKVYSS